jgi:hypothetical protein
LIDRYLLRSAQTFKRSRQEETRHKIAVIIDFAGVRRSSRRSDSTQRPFSATIVKVLGWANDPAFFTPTLLRSC